MEMPKIYTRTGDRGTTGLLGGSRVSKDDPVIEAVGSVDELNSCIGLGLIHVREELLATILRRVQSELFALGAELSSEGRKIQGMPHVTAVMVERLEREIDGMSQKLPEQKSFILPGGSKSGAALHLARSVARRTERRIVSISGREGFNGHILSYVNRLCDFLHVAARYANYTEGIAEHAPVYEKQD